MGDEKEENTRLLLSIPEKHLPELLHRLLPEFDAYFTESDTAPIRPPKAIWWKKIIDSAKLLVFLAIGWTLMITVFGVTGLPAVLGLYRLFRASNVDISDRLLWHLQSQQIAAS